MGSLYSSVELVPSASSVHLTIALTDSIHSNDLLNQRETIDLPYSPYVVNVPNPSHYICKEIIKSFYKNCKDVGMA